MTEVANSIRGGTKGRDSNIELFRILLMFLIIAHHYTVNSGLTDCYNFNNVTLNMVFLQIFGMFGKAAINGFTLITGYYMVKSNITVKKFLKLYLEAKFYYFMFYLIFLVTGYEPFSAKGLVKTVFSIIYESGSLYTGTYIVFFLFIPFLNILVKGMTKKQYQGLLGLAICYFTIFSTFFKHDTFNFIGWMEVAYLIGGYISLYPCKLYSSKKISALFLAASVALMVASIVVVDFVGAKYGFGDFYYMVADSHKLFALTCSVAAFLLFKNIKVAQNKIINQVAASTFGILLIHTNSVSMRRFLWKDLLQNTMFYDSKLLVFQAFGSVCLVYVVCLLIDQLRIKFIEKPIYNKIENNKYLGRISQHWEEI